MSKYPDAAHYDAMTADQPGVELPDDQKPVSKDALRARKNAIREGRLMAPARDTVEAAHAETVVTEAEVEVEVSAEAEVELGTPFAE